MDFKRALGFTISDSEQVDRHLLIAHINLQLVALGFEPAVTAARSAFMEIAEGLLESYREKTRLLRDYRCPADRRIEAYLADHFAPLNLPFKLRLPDNTFVLDRHGLARELSLPVDGDSFSNSLLSSYRVRNGVLHNPRADRRTTVGTFHVTEGGLPVPGDKSSVPQRVFAEMFRHAMNPPNESMILPFTDDLQSKAATFVSLLLRPTVCPEVEGVTPVKSMEVRFFAPGSLVSNLDFVESIFGNAGDPYLPQNDAGLDVEHWTGHTGCVILAPHLTSLTKKQLGLPHYDAATERQKRDGMCWKKDDELYNNGTAFKLTCRTDAGVIVTLIADNYYGYCKKEVKTQISYAANLFGNAEEEHAGGAIAFPTYSHGEALLEKASLSAGRTFDDVVRDYGTFIDVKEPGYGVDREHPEIIYIPGGCRFSVPEHKIEWSIQGQPVSIPLVPGKIYITPIGDKLRIEKHPGAPSWRLIGSTGEGTFCHKPCTVSGGGKSEISKSLVDYMLYGPLFIADVEKDLDRLDEIFSHDYSMRWKPKAGAPERKPQTSRAVLSRERSLGSVIKLLQPSTENTDEYNAWLASFPSYIWPLVFIIKRFYKPEKDEKGNGWRSYFSVDVVNGFPGNELKYNNRKLVGTYLRVGLLPNGGWRTFKVRQDFAAASKIQTEDDISASVVVPGRALKHLANQSPASGAESYKFVTNCEYRLFQRPDEAIHPGLDRQTELDLSRKDCFISNFEPLTSEDARRMLENVAEFTLFTPPMQETLRQAAAGKEAMVVCSASPRLVDGKPSKNPRYLQNRPDLMRPLESIAAARAMRLARRVPIGEPVHVPVDAVLIGRRNNPPEPEARIRALAVYGPIHYQELPELFMDFVCSLTGKSPSTTGAGSEGALTKSPFNALRPTADLNNALVSYILTGLAGFSTSAGHVGPNQRVDHDISLLIPEIWCRLTPAERDPAFLIANELLEPVKDFTYEDKLVPASRLGYRITQKFVRTFFGRVFDNPGKVFDEEILKPEKQDMATYVDGIYNIAEAQQRVAQGYLDDGSIEDACPPLRAILYIMATGTFEGMDAHDSKIRSLFTRQSLLDSAWYKARLAKKQQRDVSLWQRHADYAAAYLKHEPNIDSMHRAEIEQKVEIAHQQFKIASSPAYLLQLVGTLGADPMGKA